MSTTFTAELPSGGVFYGDALPGGVVNLKRMGAEAERLMVEAGGDPTAKLRRIIELHFCDQEKIPTHKLLLTDCMYIMLMLRIDMFGSRYSAKFRCSACGSSHDAQVDLVQDLNVKRASDLPEEGLTVDLPCGDKVTYKFLTLADAEYLARKEKRSKMNDDGTFASREVIVRQLVTVNGEVMEEQALREYVYELLMRDTNEFRLAVEEVESGLDLTYKYECPNCGEVNESALQFSPEFFRPSQRINRGH